MAKYTFEEICKTIKTDDGLNLKQTLHFHCFNENGVVNAKYRANEAINEAIDAGICKSGAFYAYAMYNGYTDKLMKMARNKRVNKIQLNVIIKLAWGDVKKSNDFIAEKKALAA